MIAGLLTGLAFAVFTLVACLRLVTSEREHAATERAKHAEQLQVLLQRIQAPEQAVVDHAISHSPVPVVEPVGMDDDAAHWARNGEPVSKEQLAEFSYMSELA